MDRKKKRIVFLDYDQIVNLATLAEMHTATGEVLPVSETWTESLKSSAEVLNKVLEGIWEAEGDGE